MALKRLVFSRIGRAGQLQKATVQVLPAASLAGALRGCITCNTAHHPQKKTGRFEILAAETLGNLAAVTGAANTSGRQYSACRLLRDLFGLSRIS